MVSKVKSYLGELVREFKRINWPSRGDALRLSGVVIVISLLVAAFLGSLDIAFQEILKILVS